MIIIIIIIIIIILVYLLYRITPLFVFNMVHNIVGFIHIFHRCATIEIKAGRHIFVCIAVNLYNQYIQAVITGKKFCCILLL